MFSSSSYVLHLQAAYPVKTPVAPRPQTCNATRPTMPGYVPPVFLRPPVATGQPSRASVQPM